MLYSLFALAWVHPVFAFPQNHWVLQSGEQLEVLRDYICFNEGKAGERTTTKTVLFSKDVLSAEVVLSGFNVWQTRGGDSEVAQVRIDSWVTGIGTPDPDNPKNIGNRNQVHLKFMYSLKDEDPTGKEDYNDACIGFTVVAKTK
jgi:hypothetical protein